MVTVQVNLGQSITQLPTATNDLGTDKFAVTFTAECPNSSSTHSFTRKSKQTMQTRCRQEWQILPPTLPNGNNSVWSQCIACPGKLNKTYASSLILAHLLHYVKIWRQPQNRNNIVFPFLSEENLISRPDIKVLILISSPLVRSQ